MPNPVDSQIRQTIDRFVDEISQLVREAAVEAVRDALGQGGASRPGTTKARRPAGTSSAAAAPRKAKKTGKRGRRSSADLEAQGATILEHVKANPGVRMEALSKALGEDTKDLRRPVQELIASGQLRTEGARRGTQYFAGGGRRKTNTKKRAKTSKKKGRRKKAA